MQKRNTKDRQKFYKRNAKDIQRFTKDRQTILAVWPKGHRRNTSKFHYCILRLKNFSFSFIFTVKIRVRMLMRK